MNRFLLFFCMLFTLHSMGQSDLKGNGGDIKIAALPYYNFGKGVGITSSDSLFQFNIRFRMQNRVTYYDYEDKESNYDAQIKRLRLRFDGYVGDPKFQYAIQLSFSPGDVGPTKDGGDINIIRDAVVTYRPNKHWSFVFGQTKLPGNRQRVNSSGALQLTDRSINNARFNIDRDFGIQAYYLHENKEKFAYNIKTAISAGKGRNWSGKDENVALTGKLELYPFGNFSSLGEYFEGDLKREKKPKLMISGAYHINHGSTADRGQLGNELFEERDLENIFIDAIAKYRGWSAMYAFMSRNTDNPVTYLYGANGVEKTSFVAVGSGHDFSLSYLFLNNYEVIGRFSTMTAGNTLFKLNVPDQKQYSFGVTKYVWEHAFKVQAEVSYDQLHYFNGNDKNNWYARFQIEIGI